MALSVCGLDSRAPEQGVQARDLLARIEGHQDVGIRPGLKAAHAFVARRAA
jgi:hypothetical protein